jgi:fumarylacetoacetate (FAA) hydrolase
MRLATPAGGGLAVVGDDGLTARPVTSHATLTDWLARGGAIEAGDPEPLDPATLGAVLPLTHTFLDGSAYVNHVELVRRARGAEMPASFWTDPLMYQGCAAFDGPRAPYAGDPAWGMDFEGEVAVICGPVPRGASPDEAAAAIRLVTILNDWSLRGLIPGELAKGFGFVQSKPPSAMAPFAVAPDALPGWDGGRLQGTLRVELNDAPFGRVATDEGMTFDFARLVAHAARTRDLPAGAVIGSGTVSNRDADGGPGRPAAQGGRGYACIAEQRMVETILGGAPATPFLAGGDRVRIWYENDAGHAPFGVMDHEIRELESA